MRPGNGPRLREADNRVPLKRGRQDQAPHHGFAAAASAIDAAIPGPPAHFDDHGLTCAKPHQVRTAVGKDH